MAKCEKQGGLSCRTLPKSAETIPRFRGEGHGDQDLEGAEEFE